MDELKGFSSEMRKHFVKLGKTDAEIAELESGLANKGQAAREAGLESKEADPPAPEPVVATPEPPTADTPVYATQAEVTQMHREVTQALANVLTQLNAMTAEVKAIKAKQIDPATPRASVWELASQMAVGNPDAVVDGRTALAKAGPKQAEHATAPAVTPSPLLNSMMQRAQGGA